MPLLMKPGYGFVARKAPEACALKLSPWEFGCALKSPVMFGPNITGSFYVGNAQYKSNQTSPSPSGAFSFGADGGVIGRDWSPGLGGLYSLSAQKSQPLFGAAQTVQPPSLRLLPCIKT